MTPPWSTTSLPLPICKFPLSSKPQSKFSLVRLKPNNGASDPSSEKKKNKKKNAIAIAMEFPRDLWGQALKQLSNFGFGRRSIWEGGVGLFIVSGAVLLALSLAWLNSVKFRSRLRKYVSTFEFEQACGISAGTPVRIRGVNVGSVVRVDPSLRCIDALVEIEDDKIFIPRNSRIEVNQSGLLLETMIDVTPSDPIPAPSFSPLHPNCVQEGLIVCNRQRMKGYQGVSIDALVGIFTRIGREMESIGLANSYSLAMRVASVIEEAKPLLAKVKAMADDVQPMLAAVHESGLLKEVETLTRFFNQSIQDLRSIRSSIDTPENTKVIQKSIQSLIFSLKNIESITSDVLDFTGDESTRRNLKSLIKSLSRLL